MKFNRSREQKAMESAWEKIIRSSAPVGKLNSIKLYGPRGSGKTHFVQDLVRTQRGNYYMSFEGMTREEALQKFARLYLPEDAVVSSWADAAKAFADLRYHRRTLLIFEDEAEELQSECKEAFAPYTRRKGLFRICEITHEISPKENHCVPIPFLSIADYCENLSVYTRADVMRLHALTGGIPAVAKELETQRSFEENVRQLLAFDSVFSTYLPERMRLFFRTPESYYPLLKSIAIGHNRLSEIAKDAGFPNNKCGKYLEALIDAGFVVAEHDKGSYAKYYLANSYYAAWCRYVWQQKSEQIMRPDEHLHFVLSDLDEALALPLFQNACRRFINIEISSNPDRILPESSHVTRHLLPVKMQDGSSVILDFREHEYGGSEVYVLPQSLTMRYTKAEMQAILRAVKGTVSLFETEITVFGLERFSDWCVHESAKREYLHEVTMDRLRY